MYVILTLKQIQNVSRHVATELRISSRHSQDNWFVEKSITSVHLTREGDSTVDTDARNER